MFQYVLGGPDLPPPDEAQALLAAHDHQIARVVAEHVVLRPLAPPAVRVPPAEPLEGRGGSRVPSGTAP